MNIKKLMKGLFGGSIVLLITINIFNALNYFFHFAMARLLTTADYGILAVLMSIVFIFNVPSESIQTIFSKYSTSEKNLGRLKNMIKKGFRRGFQFSLLIFVFYLLLCLLLSEILNISYVLLAFVGLFILVVFLIPITRGIMQGKKQFNALGFNMIFEAGIKIILAIIFVLIGLRIYGAIAGVILGAFFAILLSFVPIKKIFLEKEEKASSKIIYGYSLPIAISIFTVFVFFSIDIIVAKAVFSAEMAGYYAIASMMAKAIFFGTIPISKAMFPISSENEENHRKTDKILYQSLGILAFAILAALLIIYFFPDLLIRIFAGRYIIQSAGILFFVAIAISLISFTNLILLQKISVGKIKNYLVLPLFILIEISLFWYFSDNLIEYSFAFIAASAAFLWASIVIFGRD